jgi:hypothetical protein
VTAVLGIGTACTVAEAEKLGDPKFPLDWHPLFPQYGPNTGQIAAGHATGRVLEQPIGFSHYLHAGEMRIDCQYCHSEARRSIHSGVPPLQTCMGCHAEIRNDSPEVQKIHLAWCGKPRCTAADQTLVRDVYGQLVANAAAKPIPWNRVHDLPDYVHFNHSRHVKSGVNCTECHGQVQLQGTYELVPLPPEAAAAAGMPAVEGATYRKVDKVMVREATLQMGWCVNCHESHASVDENYADAASLRRAELKDCWTCHK